MVRQEAYSKYVASGHILGGDQLRLPDIGTSVEKVTEQCVDNLSHTPSTPSPPTHSTLRTASEYHIILLHFIIIIIV